MWRVNEHTLPSSLVDLIESERWRIPESASAEDWERVFNHGGISFSGDMRVKLFDLGEMVEKTAYLVSGNFPVELRPDWSHSMIHRGVDPATAKIDPAKCVVIADLLYSDRHDGLCVPVVLDYRKSVTAPSVYYYPDDAFELYWCQIFENIDELRSALSL